MSCEFKEGNVCLIKQHFARGGSLYYETYGTACDGPAWSAFCSTKRGGERTVKQANKPEAKPESKPKAKGNH